MGVTVFIRANLPQRLPPVTQRCQRKTMNVIGQLEKKKASGYTGLYSSLHFLKQQIGGAGGNRTRVRKSSTGSSTYLVQVI